jgi:integrase
MKSEEVKQYECVKRWLNEVYTRGTGSTKTRELYPKFLAYFLDFAKLSPDSLIKLAEEDPQKAKQLLTDFMIEKEKGGLARNTTVTIFYVVTSFLRENDIVIRGKGPKAFPSARRKTVTKDDVRRFTRYANQRLRAFVTMMKDCGMSPEDILKLKYGDIRKDLEAGKVPVKLSIIRMKTKVQYETFIGPDGVQSLKDYLDARKIGTDKIPSEELTDDSPLFRTSRAKVAPVSYNSLSTEFQRTRKRAGTAFSIYDLRRFFSTNMKAAGANETLVEYWMGHKLPGQIDPYLFSPENQDQIYMGHYQRISLAEEPALTKETQEQQLLASARLLGIPEDKITELKAKLGEMKWYTFSDITSEDWQKIIPKMLASERRRVRPRSKKKGRKKRTTNDCESRYVTEKQLPKFISEGWEFVAPVNGKILIKKRD